MTPFRVERASQETGNPKPESGHFPLDFIGKNLILLQAMKEILITHRGGVAGLAAGWVCLLQSLIIVLVSITSGSLRAD